MNKEPIHISRYLTDKEDDHSTSIIDFSILG